MISQYTRMELVFGTDAVAQLHEKRVAVFGIGGVGGYVMEALARSGIGTLDLYDNDTVSLTNINRQLLAVHSTIGQAKVDAAEARIHDIDPQIIVNKHKTFYLPDSPDSEKPDFSKFDYIVDAIDTVTAKISIIVNAQKAGVPVISCMGCGNRVDPTKLTVCDIFETKNDPLAKIMRHELRKSGVKSLKVVCSTEPAIRPVNPESVEEEKSSKSGRRDIPGSTAFVPPTAGLLAASVVVRELTKFNPGDRVKGR